MDILSLLEEVQNESLILRHPLVEEDISFSYIIWKVHKFCLPYVKGKDI